MNHIDYLFEDVEHPEGTYASLIPSTDSKEKLFRFCSDIGIPNLMEIRDYHCTLIHSDTPVPEIITEDFGLPILALMKGFKVLGDKKFLVIELYCPDAKSLNERLSEKYGATSDFPDFIPHISIAKNFEGEVPTDIFDGQIEFTGQKISEID